MLLLKGILLGLMLTIMVGPIAFTLIQIAVEKGLKSGIIVGLGVWVSDLFYILSVYFGISYVQQVTSVAGFEKTMGLAGGIILISFGAGTVRSTFRSAKAQIRIIAMPLHPFQLWLKGFLVNSVNPFTVFFWLGVISKALIEDKINGTGAFLYLGGILGTVVVTDSLKVYLARSLRAWLTIRNILWLRRISGIALVIFGAILIYRVW